LINDKSSCINLERCTRSHHEHLRLSAGRSEMSDEMQALCFMAGANSISHGDKLLTTGNPDTAHDRQLFERLNLVAEPFMARDSAVAALG
jgi:biotin synthase-like enzyme